MIMIRIHHYRMPALGSGAVVASAVLALGAGCSPQSYVQPAVAPTYVEGASVVPSGAEPVDADFVYVEEPPVSDLETYPSVDYGGVAVYYVGGQWYRRGPRGWAYYRREPTELGRQRESHAHDAQWERGRAVPRSGPEQSAPPARPGIAAPQDERRVAPARPEETKAAPERPRGLEPQAPEHGAAPGPVDPSTPNGTKAPAKQDETQAPPAKKRGRPPVKGAPHAPERR
jgi:hypothetical protein